MNMKGSIELENNKTNKQTKEQLEKIYRLVSN